ncbi:MAG: asparagine synthase (glutamine-hydrolyzing) [Pirellulaceae bacterium]
MCGITGGVWSVAEKALSAATLTRMADVLRHRGPDDDGYFRSESQLTDPCGLLPGVALGFRRLAIIDLALASQPLSNEDGTVRVVFNGEIYNFAALRRRLEGAGHLFRTKGDGEVIVHLYEDLGAECFSHFNGMFAIAIWDARRGRLVLGRDRLGKKPLVYRREPNRLLFASELKSLLQVPGVPREIDPTALDHYLTYQYIPHPWTIFRGIRKLPPGHYAVYEDERLTVEKYWTPDFRATWLGNEQDAIAALQTTLESAVQLRMQSDVPLGAFLSGGVDSSLIVALMQRSASQPVKTFSIGFPVREYDETGFARRVAAHLKTDHHEFQVSPDGLDILPRLVWHYDEPFADSSAIPTWYVAQLTRQHVTVALSGDGGDELFVGYPRYQAARLGMRLDRITWLKKLLSAPFWQRLPAAARQKSKLRQFRRFSAALGLSPARRYLDWISTFGVARRAALYSDTFLEQLPPEDPFSFLEAALKSAEGRDPITALSLADLQTYLPCDLMTKVDIASMAHSLECRQPFMDFRLVELAASLPLEWKFRHGRGKRILQRAFGDLLPNEIWSRQKMGFGVPLDHWFRHELRALTRDVLLDQTARGRGYFREESVAALIDQHEKSEFDHAYRLWALLVLELWLREWCDSPLQPAEGCR